jgi:hypothetical protein
MPVEEIPLPEITTILKLELFDVYSKKQYESRNP